MIKRWLHIILSVWLINAVTYFHCSNPAEPFNVAQVDYQVNNVGQHINSWTDYLIETVAANDDTLPAKAHKIKVQRRYVRTRSFNDQVFLSTPNFFLQFQHLKNAIVDRVSNYTIGVALLPAYYNFLFRLSPF